MNCGLDPKYLNRLIEIDEEAYGPGTYDWRILDKVAIMIAENGNGFVSYRVKKEVIEIEKMAVHKAFRRRGIGTGMLHWLVTRARQLKIKKLRIMVTENNISGCLFLAARGFESRLEGRVIIFEREIILN